MRRANRPTRPLDVARVLAARRRHGLVAVWDLDGTLAPIAPTPAEARVPPATRQALRRLARRPDTLVGVVSGRPLAQVEQLVGRASLWLAGLHGGARRMPGGHVRHLWGPTAARRGARLAHGLAETLAGVPGVRIEPKGPVVAVHVRGADAAGRARARVLVGRARPPGWVVLEGRRVLELRPRLLPNKGDAVRWIASRRPGAVVLYVGDDATDEDAFAALGPGDFAVRVESRRARVERGGRGARTHARWKVAGHAGVVRLIERLCQDAPATPARRPAPERALSARRLSV
jgi:trehalose-phosphatase